MDCHPADGVVIVVVLCVILLLSALVAALTSVTASELLIAANFRNNMEASYAAAAAADRALIDLASMPDWGQALTGTTRSAFVDGAPSGTRMLPDGNVIDLSQVSNLANCRKPAQCSDGDMNLITVERPRGANNPRWQLFAYGPLANTKTGVLSDSSFYAIVLVGDDPSEIDDNPLVDATQGNPGAGMLALRSEAFGPRSAHKVVELTVGRTAAGRLRVLSWRQLR